MSIQVWDRQPVRTITVGEPVDGEEHPMRVFSRIGMISTLAAAGMLLSGAGSARGQSAPATTSSALLTRATDGVEITLQVPAGHWIALHRLAGDAAAVQAAVREFATQSSTLAGLANVFILEDTTVPDWLSKLDPGVAESICFDRAGTTVARFFPHVATEESIPEVVVQNDKNEIFRLKAASRADYPRFADFARRFIDDTRDPAIGELNLPKDTLLAVSGYDVVAYMTQNKAIRGQAELSSTYRGVKYRFANEAHRALFAREPEKYVPTYGGWCASAMGAKGTKVEIDPTSFKLKDGRLFLFYKSLFSNALEDWNKHEREWEPAADRNWQGMLVGSPSKAQK